MSNASFKVVSFFACIGALPPASEVEKNTGSISSKSPSACMRSISTEPTMPRQPTSPVTLSESFMLFMAKSPSKSTKKRLFVLAHRAGKGHNEPGLLAFDSGRFNEVANRCKQPHALLEQGGGNRREKVSHLRIVASLVGAELQCPARCTGSVRARQCSNHCIAHFDGADPRSTFTENVWRAQSLC